MAIIDSVSIGNEIRDIYDKNAIRGTSVKVASNGVTGQMQFFLVWENTGAYSSYKNPLQISGEMGFYTGGTKFDVECTLNSSTNRFTGYLEDKLPTFYHSSGEINYVNLLLTKEGTGGQYDTDTHFRLYVFLYPTGNGAYLQSSINITPPNPVGTFYSNPTPTSTYQGNIVAQLSDIIFTADFSKSLLVTTYTSPDTNTRRFTFTNNAISDSKTYNFYCDVFGVAPKAVNINGTTMTVDFDASDLVSKCCIHIRI